MNRLILSFLFIFHLGFSQSNYFLSFDGVDDGVTINDNQSLDLTTASITAWVKSTTSDSLWQTILSKGPDPYESYGIFLKYGTILHIVNVIDGSRVYWEPTDTLTLNDWTYVAVTFNGDTSRAYINGIEVGTNALSGSVTSNDYGLEFGIRSGSTALNGMLDEVALWDTVLTQSEIQFYMSTSPAGSETGLVSYWNFNEGSGTTLADQTSNGNNGTISGATWNTYVPGCTDPYAGNYDSTATGDDGSCTNYPDNGEYTLSFDGVDDRVVIQESAVLKPTSELTIAAWVYPHDVSSNSWSNAIFSKGGNNSNTDSYWLGFKQGSFTFLTSSGQSNTDFHYISTSSYTGSENNWYHVAATFDKPDKKIYINGVEQVSDAWDHDIGYVESPHLISGEIQNGNYILPFDGNIDEVSFWDRALTQNEIQNSMLSGFSGDEDGLQGYWKFDTGADTIAYDHSGNANHGGINGAAWNVSLTYVPDDNFEQALIDLGYDDVLDDYVVTDSINSVTTLNVSNDSISDLTGIEDFTALTNLNCRGNQLTSLDVSSNTALTELTCYANALDSLDVSSNTALTELHCSNNQLTSLDVSSNTALTFLDCGGNALDSLDVSNNTALSFLNCGGNALDSLDVSSNTALTDLSCDWNQLTSLNVSNNTTLTELACNNNQLTNLDVSNNTALTKLNCDTNQLISLDVSNNTALTRLDCYHNDLTNLDVTNNVNLTRLNTYGNALDTLDVSNNVDLTYLTCVGLQSSNLDVSNNIALSTLNCHTSQLTSLDVSNNTDLTYLNCRANQLDSLDVSNNTALTDLRCQQNGLTYLNMRNGVTAALTYFQAEDNSLTCIETLDPDYATANWTYANGNIDDGVTFSVICGSSDLSNWHVDTTGSDRQGTGTAENPFATIQIGINASSDGSSVLVGAGTYVENINYNGKNISILGANRETTIIDGDSSGSVVRFEAGEDSTASLSGFTLRNGSGTMINETQSKGGGIYCTGSSPTLIDLKITNNTATTWGGGIHCEFTSNPVITDVFIMENSTNDTASGQGGGLYCWYSAPKLTNVLIANNSSIKGGGVYLGQQGSWAKLTNVTITDNNSVYGGGIWLGYLPPGTQPADKPTVLNSIIWNNTPQQIYYSSEFVSIEMDISYSSIEGGLDSIVTNSNGTVNWGAGNIDNYPFFCEPDSGDYTLAENSSCVGTGEGGANMGAFGIGCGVINQGLYVPENFATIQEGINAAFAGDTIFVAAGTYVEKINFNGKNIAMIGAGQDSTIIDGNQDSTVVVFSNGEDSSSVISGFTIKNGQGRNGGGIHCGNNSSPRIENLVITNNVADFGGGIQCFNSSPTIRNVIITGNTAGNDGGGIHCFNASPTLENVEITDNLGTWKGGGLGVFSSSDVIAEHVTMNNNSSNSGAGVYCSGSNPTFTNSILWNSMTDEIHLISGSVTASYSDVLGGWTGQGNINTEPLFCDPSTGDYYLAQNSPCIGAGENGSSNIGAYGAGCSPILTIASEVLPETYALHQNYPNPFNPITTLRYDLPEDSHVNITVYDMLGRVVKTMVNQPQNAGFRFIIWDATNDFGKPISAGIYLYKIQAGEYISTKKMVLLK